MIGKRFIQSYITYQSNKIIQKLKKQRRSEIINKLISNHLYKMNIDMMDTRMLIGLMNTSQQRKQRNQSESKLRKTKISFERNNSKNKYVDFTNLSKTQQLYSVKGNKKQRRSDWKYDFYRTRNSFSVCEQQKMEDFPDNNTKYNIQFLEKNLKGQGLKFPIKDLGCFPKTSRSLYSKHYRPIVNEKRKYNEEYQLRPSKFGNIWLDVKRERIMDMYRLQMNPFSTRISNDLIAKNQRAR